MSIYLQGVCLSFPFYLSKHIWCPVAGASNRNVCFPEDACSLFIQFCALVWLCGTRQNKPLVSFLATPVKVCQAVIFPLCVFQSVTWTIHVPYKHFKPPELIDTIPLVLQTARTPVEPTWASPLHSLKYAFTATSNVTANPQGGIDCSGPMGVRGTYLCGSRWLSLRIM